MSQELRKAQSEIGAVFEKAATAPLSFGNDAAAIQAAKARVAVCDRSHWGRIRVTDSDRQTFLHNQSTNDLKSLQPGQGADTVFVTSTARTIDLATTYVLEDAVLVVTAPNRCNTLLTWLDRYIFFGDKVKLTDVTPETAMFSLVGPGSDALLKQLGVESVESIEGQSYASHRSLTLAEHPVRVAVGSGLALAGYTLITEAEAAEPVWSALVQAGAVPLGDRAWEQLRIEQGRPMPERELTEDYNPLEAGLWQAVSFNKGCYIGQETIARLDAYKGVKQRLWGIRLSAPAEPGTVITLEEEKVGTLTSVTETEHGSVGLAYIRTKAGGEGLKVQVGSSEGEVVAVPFLTHDRLDRPA